MFVAASFGGELDDNSTMCIGGTYTPFGLEKVNVTYGTVVNITFLGVPAFNVTRSVRRGSDYVCDTNLFQLNTTVWTWNVPNDTVLYQPGNVVTFTAKEIPAEGNKLHPYFYSPAFVLTNTSATTSSAIAGPVITRGEKKQSSIQTLMICMMMMLSVFFSIY